MPVSQGLRDADTRVKDIQTIHNPRSSRLIHNWKRAVSIGQLELKANPDAPSFSARVNAYGIGGLLLASVANAYQPRQAAGWATLMMYRHKTTVIGGDDWLFVTDPRPETAHKAVSSDIQDVLGSAVARIFLNDTSNEPLSHTNDEILFGFVDNHDGSSSTSVSFRNTDRRLPLPGMLSAIQRRYEYLYPDPNFDSSYVVAGIVGAASVEEFSEAWQRADQIANPVSAARTLFESEVFLDC